jgi:hypothetical protein
VVAQHSRLVPTRVVQVRVHLALDNAFKVTGCERGKLEEGRNTPGFWYDQPLPARETDWTVTAVLTGPSDRVAQSR